MNKSNFRFSYKPVLKNQKELIRTWIAQDHIKEWLHGDGLKNTLIDLEKFGIEPSLCQHWIAYDHDVPFAYLITSKVDKVSPEDSNAITLDLFICRVDYIGKGLAVKMIHEFLLNQSSDIDEVLIDPEIANARAVHVYKKAGFNIIKEFIASWHPVPHYQMRLLMKDLNKNTH